MAVTDGDQRTRILDAALRLMGEQGAQPTSMRQLASACGINVATLYHYFPSKSDLLGAVIEERNYLDGLAIERPPVSRRGGPRTRLVALIRFIADSTIDEEAVWKLVLGETVRSDPVASAMARQLSDGLDEALARWIPEIVPEFDGDVAQASRIVRSALFSLLIEQLITPEDEAVAVRQQMAEDLAVLLLP